MPGTARPAPGGVTPGSESERAGIVTAAAKKWGIPAWVLWGVYGTETNFGSNVATSSTGAMGSFQFEPGTAASYNYPLTNATDLPTFAAQADSAAHLLSDLFGQTKTWSTAISDYNAGPAGAFQPSYVKSVEGLGPGIGAVHLSNSVWVAIATALGIAAPIAAAAAGPEAIIAALGGSGAAGTAAERDATAGAGAAGGGGAAGYAAKGLSDLASLAKAGGLAALLVDPGFLLRMAKIIGGFVLLLLGVRQLANAGGANLPGPGAVAAAVAK